MLLIEMIELEKAGIIPAQSISNAGATIAQRAITAHNIVFISST